MNQFNSFHPEYPDIWTFWSVYEGHFALQDSQRLCAHLLDLQDSFGDADEHSSIIGSKDLLCLRSQAELVNILRHFYGKVL
jgi:hypothetical protein